MMTINWPEKIAREGHRIFLSGLPIAMHCHHYNINLQKTLEESLGDDGIELLYQASLQSNYDGFRSFLEDHLQLKTEKSKLELAATSYQYCGLGVILLDEVDQGGGTIISPHSHHVTGWLAKHGRRETPGCNFTRGWISGVLSVIYQKEPGYYDVRELKCKMARDAECVFECTPKRTGSNKQTNHGN